MSITATTASATADRPEAPATQPDLLRLAKELDLPLVATNDLHYTHAHDAQSHAALLCVQSGSTMSDPNRFKFDSDECSFNALKTRRIGHDIEL